MRFESRLNVCFAWEQQALLRINNSNGKVKVGRGGGVIQGTGGRTYQISDEPT